MVELKHIRILCACCCFPYWYNYYSFLHNFIRTFDICIDTFKGISSTLWKILFMLFMWCIGFQCISCILCLAGCIHCFKEPCQKYQGGGSWHDAFHHLVYESKCEVDAKIREQLNKIFKK